MISTSSVANCRCNSRPLSADVHSEGIAPSQTDLTADNRFEFLRNVGMTVASTVSGLALLPEMGKAEVVTDDVLGFKFEVRGAAISYIANRSLRRRTGIWGKNIID